MQETMSQELARIQANNRAYLQAMPYSTPVVRNQFTGSYWKHRNISYYLQYENAFTSSLYEAYQRMQIMLSEISLLPALKQQYGSVLPYPEQEEN